MGRILIWLACWVWLAPAWAQDDGAVPSPDDPRGYTITVDGVSAQANPGETVEITLKDGRTVRASIKANPFVRWSDSMLAFDHPSKLSVATHKLSGSIVQRMMASAIGTVIIIQEYSTLDPSSLKQLMMDELTKTDVKAGAEFAQSNVTKKLVSGAELSGLKGRLKFRKETKTIEVFSYAADGQGILLMTMISDDHRDTDQSIVDMFWDTLTLKF